MLVLAQMVLAFVYAVISPFLPILVRSLGYSAALVGVLLAVYEGAGILGPFLICRFADRHGKYKSCILLSFLLIALAAFPLAAFNRPLLSAVFIAVLAVGFRSTTPLIDSITTINIGKSGNYGKIRVCGSIAFVLFGFFLQWIPVLKPNTEWNISLWLVITAAFAMAVIAFLPLQPKNKKNVIENVINKKSGDSADGDASIWTPFFITGLVCIALNRMAITPVYSFLSLFLVEYMQWNAVGLMWSLAAIAEIPFLYVSHRLIRRFGAMPILAFTSVMLVLRLALYAIFPFKAGVIIAQLLHSFCFGLFHPAAVAFITGCVPPDKRSYGMTIYLSLGQGLPLLAGNFIGGFIVDHAGYRVLFASFTIFALSAAILHLSPVLKAEKFRLNITN